MGIKTRREFMTHSAILGGALVARSASTLAAPPNRKLGWALCGLGSLSEKQIAPALQKANLSRLAGVITDTPAKASEWKARYGLADSAVFTYETMHRLADNADIDVVYIVTPNALHADEAAAAFKAGKHVFCEKPMEVSVERCQKMIDDAQAANRRLGIAYRCRYDPNHLECIRIARSKEFGDIKMVSAGFNISIGDPDQWRLKRALSGGGALVDVGIYALQAARYLTGEEPVEVAALEGKTRPHKYAEVDESMLWQMRFPSGAVANCSASYETALDSHLRVDAEKGWFGLDPAFLLSGNHGLRSDGREINLPSQDMFMLEMDDFSRCILENRESRVAGEEGLRDVRIMTAIYEAAHTGRTVKLGMAPR